MPRDIVERLRDRAYAGLPDPLLAEAADEIERLRDGALAGCEAVQPVASPMPASPSGIGSVTPVTLTDAERRAVEFFSKIDGPGNVPVANQKAATLRGLLERLGN